MHLSTRMLANENEKICTERSESSSRAAVASANSRAEKDVRESGSDSKNIRGDRLCASSVS